MKVAVLMSTYNGENFIKEQINSILKQRGSFMLELWIRDDGSKDQTKTIISEYAKNNQIIRWYEGENIGSALSFIDLLIQSNEYDYYAFADQDDVWNTDKLSRTIESIDKYNEIPALAFSNAEIVDENLNILSSKVYKKYPKTDLYTLSCAGGILGCTMVLNRKLREIVCECVSNNIITNEIVMHDFFVAEVCSAVGGIITYTDYASIKYRQHNNNQIGVSSSCLEKVKGFFEDIIIPRKVSIAQQAKIVMNISAKEYCQWLERVANYKNTMLNRIQLATSRKIKCKDIHSSIKIRLSILMGNR